MKVTTKFDVGEQVWVICENCVTKLEVIRIDISIAPRYNLEMRCDIPSALIIYTLDAGGNNQKFQQYEDKVFSTKEELIKSL